MFRKKKLGGVTVLDEQDARREELFAGASVGGGGAPVQAGATVGQLEAEALREARAGKESTTRALKLATEARETGVQTAAQLAAQTKQLERMGDEIEVVHDYLDKSERIIDKMSKPKIVRMFQRKKAGGKGLDKVKAGRKERGQREELREGGVDALNIEGMQDGRNAREVEEARAMAELSDSEKEEKKRKLFGRKNAEKKGTAVRDIENDYSHYSEGVATAMKEQDKDLDQIGDMLGDMKALANAMNNELKLQETLIDEVQDFTSETRKRTQANAKRVQQIK